MSNDLGLPIDAIIEEMPLPFVILEGYIIIYANQSFCDLFNRSRDDVLNTDFRNLIYENDHKVLEERFESVLVQENLLDSFIVRYYNQHGELSTIQISSSFASFNQKKIILCIIFPLEGNKLLVDNPLIGLSVLNFLVSNKEFGLWLDNLDGNTLFVNDFLCKQLGYSLNEMYLQPVTKYLTASSKETYKRKLQTRKETEITSDVYELTLVTKSGKQINYRVVGSVLYNYVGEPISTLGIFIPIEELKKRNELQARINSYILTEHPESTFWENVARDYAEIFHAENCTVYFKHRIFYQHGKWGVAQSHDEVLETLIRSSRVCLKIDREEQEQYGIDAVITPAVFLVINIDQQPMGFIYLSSSVPDNFSTDDLKLMEYFSYQIASIFTAQNIRRKQEKERGLFSILLDIMGHDFLNNNTALHGYIDLIRDLAEAAEQPAIIEYIKRTKNVLQRSDNILLAVQQLTKLYSEPTDYQKLSLNQIIRNAIDIQRNYLHPNQELIVNYDEHQDFMVIGGAFTQNVFEHIIHGAIATEKETVRLDIISRKKIIDDKTIIECVICNYTEDLDESHIDIINRQLSRGDKRFGEEFGLRLYLAKMIMERYEGQLKITVCKEKSALQIILTFRGA